MHDPHWRQRLDGRRFGSGNPGVPNRRQVLKAAGAAAAAAPFLGMGARARAAGEPPLRLICWPLFNGAESGNFYPGGSDASVMSVITEPIRKWGGLITFIKGVGISGAENHQAIRSMYTGGSVSSYTSPDPTFKSVDSLIADSIMKVSPTPIAAVHLGVIPADDLQYYHRGQNKVFYDPTPVDYEANPVTAYDRLFGGGAAMGPKPIGADHTSESLDLIDAEMQDLGGRLTGVASEIKKLNLHRDALKGLRPSGMSMTPSPMMTSGPLPSVEKLRPAMEGNPQAPYKYEYFSDTFDAQIDIMGRVLVTGLSRVVTIQPGSADNDMIVPVGRGYPHHVTSHGNQNTFSMVQNYYFGKMARLLTLLDVADPLDPGKTVLDNTLLVMIAETLPVSHASGNVPVMLLGKLGGKVKTGGVMSVSGANNKQLMATVLRAFGQDGAQFGSTLISGVLA
jgi:hypothetical protein